MRYGAQAWHKRAALGGGSVPAEVSDTPGTFRTQTHKLGAQSVAAPSRMISLPPAAHTCRRKRTGAVLGLRRTIPAPSYTRPVHLLPRKLSCFQALPSALCMQPHAHRSARAHSALGVCCGAMRCGAASVGSVFEASSPLGARQRPTSEHHHAAQVWHHAVSTPVPNFLEYPFSLPTLGLGWVVWHAPARLAYGTRALARGTAHTHRGTHALTHNSQCARAHTLGAHGCAHAALQGNAAAYQSRRNSKIFERHE